jgi:hypothetical protein
VDQAINSKAVDQLTLYHFCTCRLWFGSTDFAGHAVEHGRKLGFSEQCLQALACIFHQFALQTSNATQHESCVPQQNTQLLYWENLKCLGEIWRTRQKYRLTLVGQKESKGF